MNTYEGPLHSAYKAERPRNMASGSAILRTETSSLHQSMERSLGLPGSIQTMGDYCCCLERFFGLYQPIEIALNRYSDWSHWGITLAALGQSHALARDLAALRRNVASIEVATSGTIPRLRNFGQALGALYVLEGSKLGGRYILRDLVGRLGLEIAGSNAFFTGHGEQTEEMWDKFRFSLDRFAVERPLEFPEVIEGARHTFASINKWMGFLQSWGARWISL